MIVALFVLQSSAMANRSKKWGRLQPRRRQRAASDAKSGTITVKPGAQPTTIRVMAYDKDRVVEQKIEDPHELKELLGKWPVVWVDVVGLGSEDKLRAIAELFQMH